MFSPLDKRNHAEDGEYIGMYVYPQPNQQPHPPLWLMSNAPFTYEFAGRSGYGVIAIMTSHTNILACWDAYKAAATLAHGREFSRGEGVGSCVAVYVADSFKQAARDIRESVNL